MSNLSELLPTGGGQNAVDFVASGTLASGQTVILQSDGTAKAISQTTVSNSVGSATQAATDTAEDLSVVSIGSSKVMFLFEGTSAYVKAVVGTISGTSISFGTVFVVNSSTSESIGGAYDSINDKVVVAYTRSYAGNYGYSRVLTVSGTSISSGSEVSFSGTENILGNSFATVFDPDTGKTVVVYTEANSPERMKVSVGAVSGTSISFTLGNQFAQGGRELAAVYDTNANALVVSFGLTGGTFEVIAGTLSGTTYTFGTAVEAKGTSGGYPRFPGIGYDSSANAFVTVYIDTSNSSYLTARAGTVSGTTVTLGSATLVSGNQTVITNAMNLPVVSNASTKTIVSLWVDPSNNYLYSSIGTISGTTITFATKYTVSAHSVSRCGAAYDPTTEKIVVMERPVGDDIDGFVYTSAGTSTNLTATNFIGITAGAISNSATGKVNVYGGIATLAGQTYAVTVANPGSGNRYYIDGILQQTLNLREGFTYKFDQSAGSNSGHPLRFSTTSNGTHAGGSEYTTGVTTAGTPGSAGAYTQIVVAAGAPTLYYYCTNHSLMGGTANTLTGIVTSSDYYVQSDGTLSTASASPAVKVGQAISATTINMKDLT